MHDEAPEPVKADYLAREPFHWSQPPATHSPRANLLAGVAGVFAAGGIGAALYVCAWIGENVL